MNNILAQHILHKTNKDRVATAKRLSSLSNKIDNIEKLNLDQEAIQKDSGYSVLNLPPNAANGPENITQKGLTATNQIRNGNFSNGVTGWDTVNADIALIDGDTRVKGRGVNTYVSITQTNHTALQEHVYYIKANMMVTNDECEKFSIWGFSGHLNFSFNTPEKDKWYRISTLYSPDFDHEDKSLSFRHYYEDEDTTEDKIAYIRDVMKIDLTKVFGEGNEPSKEECDVIFANYFGSTKSMVGAVRYKNVGLNLWDGIYENGYIRSSSGAFIPSPIRRITKNFIKVKPNTKYHFKHYNSNRGFRCARYDEGKRFLKQGSWESAITWSHTTDSNVHYVKISTPEVTEPEFKMVFCEGDNLPEEYVPYTENSKYMLLTKEGNILNLNSLPNGVKDEIKYIDGKYKLIKRTRAGYVEQDENITFGNIESYEHVKTIRVNIQNTSERSSNSKELSHVFMDRYWILFTKVDSIESIGKYHTTSPTVDGYVSLYFIFPLSATEEEIKNEIRQLQFIYQTAEQEIIPIETSGTLIGQPSGTVYIEPAVADAGVYTSKITVLHCGLPIKSLEKIAKVDFNTGLETELDVEDAEIIDNGLAFTHGELSAGDIVFFTYFYDEAETTIGETTVEFYDSRYVIEGTGENEGKFYTWGIRMDENNEPELYATPVNGEDD